MDGHYRNSLESHPDEPLVDGVPFGLGILVNPGAEGGQVIEDAFI